MSHVILKLSTLVNTSAINNNLLDKSDHIIHSSLKFSGNVFSGNWHSKKLVELNDELKIIVTANIY